MTCRDRQGQPEGRRGPLPSLFHVLEIPNPLELVVEVPDDEANLPSGHQHARSFRAVKASRAPEYFGRSHAFRRLQGLDRQMVPSRVGFCPKSVAISATVRPPKDGVCVRLRQRPAEESVGGPSCSGAALPHAEGS